GMRDATTNVTDGPWPDGARGAVSLTFDDGLPSQLRVAIPMLNEHDLRGTFYLNPRGDDWAERLGPWGGGAAGRARIGNHSLTHPCARGFRDTRTAPPALEDLTLADLEADVLEAERRLRAAIPGSTGRSFAYPCYQDYVGEGVARHSYVPVIARHFVA